MFTLVDVVEDGDNDIDVRKTENDEADEGASCHRVVPRVVVWTILFERFKWSLPSIDAFLFFCHDRDHQSSRHYCLH